MTLLRSLSVNLAELRRAQTRVGKGGFDLGMRNSPRGCGTRLRAEFEKREGRKPYYAPNPLRGGAPKGARGGRGGYGGADAGRRGNDFGFLMFDV